MLLHSTSGMNFKLMANERHKMLYTIGFHLYDMYRIGKPRKKERSCWCFPKTRGSRGKKKEGTLLYFLFKIYVFKRATDRGSER